MDDVNLVDTGQLLAVLRIEGHVGLRVVGDDLDLTAEQAARGVDFVDSKPQRHIHRLAVGVERT